MRRMWDLTYRVNAGALKYAAGSVKTASEPIVSAADMHPIKHLKHYGNLLFYRQ